MNTTVAALNVKTNHYVWELDSKHQHDPRALTKLNKPPQSLALSSFLLTTAAPLAVGHQPLSNWLESFLPGLRVGFGLLGVASACWSLRQSWQAKHFLMQQDKPLLTKQNKLIRVCDAMKAMPGETSCLAPLFSNHQQQLLQACQYTRDVLSVSSHMYQQLLHLGLWRFAGGVLMLADSFPYVTRPLLGVTYGAGLHVVCLIWAPLYALWITGHKAAAWRKMARQPHLLPQASSEAQALHKHLQAKKRQGLCEMLSWGCITAAGLIPAGLECWLLANPLAVLWPTAWAVQCGVAIGLAFVSWILYSYGAKIVHVPQTQHLAESTWDSTHMAQLKQLRAIVVAQKAAIVKLFGKKAQSFKPSYTEQLELMQSVCEQEARWLDIAVTDNQKAWRGRKKEYESQKTNLLLRQQLDRQLEANMLVQDHKQILAQLLERIGQLLVFARQDTQKLTARGTQRDEFNQVRLMYLLFHGLLGQFLTSRARRRCQTYLESQDCAATRPGDCLQVRPHTEATLLALLNGNIDQDFPKVLRDTRQLEAEEAFILDILLTERIATAS